VFAPTRPDVGNRLLSLMAPDSFARIAPHLEKVDMPRSLMIAAANQPMRHAYFPETAIGSIVAISREGHQAEVGLFGCDGFSPTELVLGSEQTPNQIIIQGAGDGWRMPAGELLTALEADGALRALLTRYAHTITIQASYTALSNAVHPVNERLARWLLMCHDRTPGNELALTHEFLAIMLAVRRPSVTTALHVLEGEGLIRTERGSVTIRDRRGLEHFAGDAYGKPEAEYERLIGPLR
jgi:CRP-like cAMP-binding protein